ncbi:hypothetical protein [Sphingomonas sp.]|uniref:hypothetical protein n=1 Tax=Sphingomonas sp. TaxID=28214 RepID=UPI0025FE8475|nr:hypothetical protein [Sphingomonas sp.]
MFPSKTSKVPSRQDVRGRLLAGTVLFCYGLNMAGELDDINAQVDCPRCGRVLNVSYRDIRVLKAASCACGALLRLEDDTPLSTVQQLIDDANPPQGDNDG